MGGPLNIGVGGFLVVALAAFQPSLSAAAAGHTEVIVTLPGRTLQSAILPDAEGRLLAMVNRERRAHGLSPLIMDASLRSVARQHAQDMARNGYVGHSSLGGQTMRARLARFLRPGTRIGENVAMVQTVDQGHRAFVASPAHLRNMLDPAFRRVGIGVTSAETGIMITEDFA